GVPAIHGVGSSTPCAEPRKMSAMVRLQLRRRRAWLLALLAPLTLACGGPQKTPEPPIGDTHATAAEGGAAPDAGTDAPPPTTPVSGELPPAGTGQPGASGPGTPGTGEPGATGPTTQPAALVTFELKNDGPGDLVFAIDKGWQPVIFA